MKTDVRDQRTDVGKRNHKGNIERLKMLYDCREKAGKNPSLLLSSQSIPVKVAAF
jgi:hypothetical protein